MEISIKKQPEKKRFLFFLMPFVLAAVFYLGFFLGEKSEKQANPISLTSSIIENKSTENKSVDFSLFWKVWDLVKNKHVNKDSLDAQKMVYGSIKGMLEATDDPYTSFMDPKETKDLKEQINGSFEGIGAELGIKEKILTVIAPLEGSPAEKAGLRPGDKIIKIDGKMSADLGIDEAVDFIRGKKGTEVKLTIFRNGDSDTQDIVIRRDVIKVVSVKLEAKDNNIAYIKINDFGEDTTKEFRAISNKIISDNYKGIVLDLRNNPGGLLDKCIETASFMLSKGKLIVTEENSSGKKENLYAKGGDVLSNIPTVVLINEGSASAAEILAGALKDNRDLTLIGKKTFGKGSVQELLKLPRSTSVKITVAKWLTPNGNYIMEKGISPDTEIEISNDDYINNRDPQLDKALELLKEKL